MLNIYYNHKDLNNLSILRVISTVLVAYASAIALIRFKKDQALKFFFTLVIFAAIIQGAVLWFSFWFPTFRDFMSLIFFRDLRPGREHLVLLRVPGFSPTGGDGLSLNQSLLTTVGLLGVFLYYNKSRFRNFLIIAIFFSMLATVFTGRSGFYLGFIFFVLILSTNSKKSNISKNLINISAILMIIFLLIIIFSRQISLYGLYLLEEHGHEHPIVRLLIGFINMESTGVYVDKTVITLLRDMVTIPHEPTRFLIGNGDFATNIEDFTTNFTTDIGYFKMWYGIGLFGLLIFTYGFFIYPVIKLHRQKKVLKQNLVIVNDYQKSVSYINAITFVLFYGLIGHYKIIFLSSRIFAFIFFILLFLIYHQIRLFQTQR